MEINKDTKICISIASQPGNFGATVHNYCYEKLGLNYIYVPLSTNNLKSTIEWIKNTPNVIGCSVSMPYKNKVLKYMDEVFCSNGNINTIKKSEDGLLLGYSTDMFAIEETLKNIDLNNKKIYVLGNGAMANNFWHVLFPMIIPCHIIFSQMNRKSINKFKFREKYDIVINATSVGMNGTNFENKEIYDLIYNADIFIDCPVYSSIKINPMKEYISGISLSLLQASKQFEIYVKNSESIPKGFIYSLMKEAIINVKST